MPSCAMADILQFVTQDRSFNAEGPHPSQTVWHGGAPIHSRRYGRWRQCPNNWLRTSHKNMDPQLCFRGFTFPRTSTIRGEVVSGKSCLKERFRDYQRSPEIPRGFQRILEMFRGIQRCSEVPRESQRASECLLRSEFGVFRRSNFGFRSGVRNGHGRQGARSVACHACGLLTSHIVWSLPPPNRFVQYALGTSPRRRQRRCNRRLALKWGAGERDSQSIGIGSWRLARLSHKGASTPSQLRPVAAPTRSATALLRSGPRRRS